MRDSAMQILTRTPAWVWLVFLLLLALGLRQRRERSVGAAGLFVLPAVMLIFAGYGVAASFGFSLSALSAWGLGVVLPMAAFMQSLTPKGVVLTPAGRFRVPGSGLPLTVMMVIFCIKYVLGVLSARHVPILDDPWFAGGIGFLLGASSGAFLARNLGIWRARS